MWRLFTERKGRLKDNLSAYIILKVPTCKHTYTHTEPCLSNSLLCKHVIIFMMDAEQFSNISGETHERGIDEHVEYRCNFEQQKDGKKPKITLDSNRNK